MLKKIITISFILFVIVNVFIITKSKYSELTKQSNIKLANYSKSFEKIIKNGAFSLPDINTYDIKNNCKTSLNCLHFSNNVIFVAIYDGECNQCNRQYAEQIKDICKENNLEAKFLILNLHRKQLVENIYSNNSYIINKKDESKICNLLSLNSKSPVMFILNNDGIGYATLKLSETNNNIIRSYIKNASVSIKNPIHSCNVHNCTDH